MQLRRRRRDLFADLLPVFMTCSSTRCSTARGGRATRSIRVTGERIETARGPLFPGYLFVALDPGTDRWREIDHSNTDVAPFRDRLVAAPLSCLWN